MNFDLDELRKECSCGHKHNIAVKDLIIKSGALKELGKMLKDGILSQYKHPLIICDENTLEATKESIKDILSLPRITLHPHNLHATNMVVDYVLEVIEPETDLILAIGSGTIHDISRYVANELKIEFVSCPTAASVDGFVSTVAAMTLNGMKKTTPAISPTYVVADTAILAKAPYRLTASGMSDLFGKYTSICDWEIAHAITGEYICKRVCNMELQAIEDVKECMDDLRSGNEEAYGKLIYALLLSGLAIQMIGNSRPASCAEHHCSHFWEMKVINGELGTYHGEQVGVGLLLVTKRYKEILDVLKSGKYEIVAWEGMPLERLKETYGKAGLYDAIIAENTPDLLTKITPEMIKKAIPEIIKALEKLPSVEELDALLKRGGCCRTVQDLGMTDEIIEPTLELAPYVRQRLGFLRIAKMIKY